MPYTPAPLPYHTNQNRRSALDLSNPDLSDHRNTAPFCLPKKSSFVPHPRARIHALPRLQTQGLVLQRDAGCPYVRFQGQDTAELAGFREYVETFGGTKADCLPETVWKDLTRGQRFWDTNGLERMEQLREMQRRGCETRKLERALEWMERVEEDERERERKKCGTVQKRWFSALRRSAQLEEEELDSARVSRVAENANGESRSNLVSATYGSLDGSVLAVVRYLERELDLVSDEVGSVEIEDWETATLSEDDRIQNWIEGTTDATTKPTVWIPPTPRSPPSPSVCSEDSVPDDGIDITEVYTEGQRPRLTETRPKAPGASACNGDEKLPVSTRNVGDARPSDRQRRRSTDAKFHRLFQIRAFPR